MKLKNKLLPLVGVATACAAVAPIALTSCKSNNDGEWVDLMTKYTPSVKALDNQTATTTEANKLYFGDETDGWKSDEDVIAQFKDDFLWTIYNADENQREYSEAKVKFDYFYIGHQTYIPSTGDAYKIPTLTYKAEFEGAMTITSKQVTRSIQYNVVNTVTNVPFHVWFRIMDEEPTWLVTPNLELMFANESSSQVGPIAWSANEKVDTTITTSYTEYGYETTETTSNETVAYTGIGTGNIEEFFNYNSEVDFGGKSHYLFSVQNGDPK